MKKVKIGFVGAGGMGTLQIKNIVERDDAEIVALFEPNTEHGKEILAELSLPESILVDDYQKIIDNSDIDTVWLASPNSFHGPQSIAGLDAGKNVFCEKPSATGFIDFCRQIELEKNNPELKTHVNYLMDFDPMDKKLKQMVGDGVFGKITQIQINYRYPIGVAGNMSWKLKKEIMGDSIGMGTIHALSAIINIMSPQAKPIAVYATHLESQVKGFESEPIYNILIKFDNGATGFCFGNIESSGGLDIYHNLSGTEGGFVFDPGTERQIDKVRYSSDKVTSGEWVWPLNVEKCLADGFENLTWKADTLLSDSGESAFLRVKESVGHFIECIKNDKKSFLSFLNSQIIAELSWAAQMSASTGKEIQLPMDWDAAGKFFN